MSRKLILFCILLALSVQIGFSQISNDAKKTEELKKEAAAFLRDTALEVGTLRTLENRISFSAEIANLLWFHDEKEARVMFQSVIIDFRQLLIQADSQFSLVDAAENDDSNFSPFSLEPLSSREQVLRKFRKAISVRQQITLSIMEHDPQMAYDFFTSTSQAVANPQLRAQFESTDAYFEIKLINAIAETDVDKALEAGRKRLEKGANFELIGLLKKIYEKDTDKGIKFGEEIVSKIKSDTSKSVNFYLLVSLLNTGADNLDKLKEKPGKKPLFSESSMREIADLLAQEILKSSADAQDGYQFASAIPLIERFSPSRAAQVKQKIKIQNSNRRTTPTEEDMPTEAPMVAPMPVGSGVVNTNAEKKSDEELLADAAKLSDKQLPKEEREKIIAQTRQAISKMKSREQKIIALSVFAAELFQMGDKELAREIMNDARSLVNLPPKNYKDYLGVWMLASGYAQADPDGAFPILEDAILRLNETISAVIKIGEFIDADEEFIEGDEVQVGAFGGSMTRELLGALGASNTTVHALAVADFARTKTLTNKFDRLEIRILAKMLVLRAVLPERKGDDKIATPKDNPLTSY